MSVVRRGDPPEPTPDEALDTLLAAFPGSAVGEPAETAVEPRTDAVWRWVVAGIRWRSCGCASAGLTHKGES